MDGSIRSQSVVWINFWANIWVDSSQEEEWTVQKIKHWEWIQSQDEIQATSEINLS